MLVLSRKVGQELVIGDNIRITINRVGGSRVTLGIQAPDDVRIVRGELESIVNAFNELPSQDGASNPADRTQHDAAADGSETNDETAGRTTANGTSGRRFAKGYSATDAGRPSLASAADKAPRIGLSLSDRVSAVRGRSELRQAVDERLAKFRTSAPSDSHLTGRREGSRVDSTDKPGLSINY